jgi:ribosomal protein L37AE/L43A
MALSQDKLLSYLRQMDVYEFEHLVADVWEQRGWETTVTTGSGDRGIDVIATKESPFFQKQIIQAKRYKQSNTVGSPDIQQYSSLQQQEPNVDSVIIVTTSSFSPQAKKIASKLNVKLVDGAELSNLILDNNPEVVLDSYSSINHRRTSSDDSGTDSLSDSRYDDANFENTDYSNGSEKTESPESIWSRLLEIFQDASSSKSILGGCPECQKESLTREKIIPPAVFICKNCDAKLKQELAHISLQAYYKLVDGNSELVGESKKVTEWRKL